MLGYYCGEISINTLNGLFVKHRMLAPHDRDKCMERMAERCLSGTRRDEWFCVMNAIKERRRVEVFEE
jgi:hypothetical protein